MNGNSGGGDLDERSALRHVRKPSQVLSIIDGIKSIFHSPLLHFRCMRVMVVIGSQRFKTRAQ